MIHARFEEDVVAKKPAIVVIIAGVNDVYQGRPAQHVKDELAAMFKQAHDAGIRVVAGSIIPYNTASADENARMHDINDWIRTQARADPGVIFVDTRAAGRCRHVTAPATMPADGRRDARRAQGEAGTGRCAGATAGIAGRRTPASGEWFAEKSLRSRPHMRQTEKRPDGARVRVG